MTQASHTSWNGAQGQPFYEQPFDETSIPFGQPIYNDYEAVPYNGAGLYGAYGAGLDASGFDGVGSNAVVSDEPVYGIPLATPVQQPVPDQMSQVYVDDPVAYQSAYDQGTYDGAYYGVYDGAYDGAHDGTYEAVQDPSLYGYSYADQQEWIDPYYYQEQSPAEIAQAQAYAQSQAEADAYAYAQAQAQAEAYAYAQAQAQAEAEAYARAQQEYAAQLQAAYQQGLNENVTAAVQQAMMESYAQQQDAIQEASFEQVDDRVSRKRDKRAAETQDAQVNEAASGKSDERKDKPAREPKTKSNEQIDSSSEVEFEAEPEVEVKDESESEAAHEVNNEANNEANNEDVSQSVDEANSVDDSDAHDERESHTEPDEASYDEASNDLDADTVMDSEDENDSEPIGEEEAKSVSDREEKSSSERADQSHSDKHSKSEKRSKSERNSHNNSGSKSGSNSDNKSGGKSHSDSKRQKRRESVVLANDGLDYPSDPDETAQDLINQYVNTSDEGYGIEDLEADNLEVTDVYEKSSNGPSPFKRLKDRVSSNKRSQKHSSDQIYAEYQYASNFDTMTGAPLNGGGNVANVPIIQIHETRKSHGWIVAIVAVVAFAFVMLYGIVSCSSIFSDDDSGVTPPSANTVAVINIDGTIQYDGSASSPEGLAQLLNYAERENAIKAVVLRVNSGGGVATAGEEMAKLVRDFSKPIVVSSASMNASAAYEISSQADYIFVSKTTEIGSIGTAFELTDISGLMDMLGIDVEVITSTDSKDSTYGYRPLTNEEIRYYQMMVNQINEVFIENVATGRGMSVEAVRKLANGMVYTGIDAVSNGLADEFGSREDAIEYAAKLAGLHTYDYYNLGYSKSNLGVLEYLL